MGSHRSRAAGWYDAERRARPDASGPPSVEQWRWRHPGLHPHDILLEALRARYDERVLEWVPYFHHWLGERDAERRGVAVEDGAIERIGYRWAGVSTSTTRSAASSR